MKTKESRFQVHDELTAPERSAPMLKGALAGGGQLPNFLGVLAGSPAALRAYARFRSELRHGSLPYATQQRIALAVAEHQGSEYALATLQRTARDAGLGLDEIALAREFDSRDERESALLRFVPALLESDGAPPRHLHEEALRGGLDGRADPRGGGPRGAGDLRQPRHPRRRRAPGRLGRGSAACSRPRRHRSGRATHVRCTAWPSEQATSWQGAKRCCSAYHHAVELVGKRWTGAILFVLMDGPLRFSEVKQLVPDLSDRLLSERMKELEAEGIVERRVIDDMPVRVEYALTAKGGRSSPPSAPLKDWAQAWL